MLEVSAGLLRWSRPEANQPNPLIILAFLSRPVSDVSPPSIVLIDLLRWSHYIGGRDESIISNEGA